MKTVLDQRLRRYMTTDAVQAPDWMLDHKKDSRGTVDEF